MTLVFNVLRYFIFLPSILLLSACDQPSEPIVDPIDAHLDLTIKVVNQSTDSLTFAHNCMHYHQQYLGTFIEDSGHPGYA